METLIPEKNMDARGFFDWDQSSIPSQFCSTAEAEEYREGIDELSYSQDEMIAFAEGYHKYRLKYCGSIIDDENPIKII